MYSSNCYFHLLRFPRLFFCKLSEEIYFFDTCWFPVIIGLECALEMCFYIDIESLRFDLRIWWVIHSRNCFSRSQMMKIRCKLMEFSTGCLFLKFSLFKSRLATEFIQLLSYFFVFGDHMIQIALPGVEIMLILSTIISSVVLLYYLGHFGKESTLFILIFILFSGHELTTAGIASPDALDSGNSLSLILKLPFLPEHSLPFLDSYCCVNFLVSILFSFI